MNQKTEKDEDDYMTIGAAADEYKDQLIGEFDADPEILVDKQREDVHGPRRARTLAGRLRHRWTDGQ